MSLLLCPRANQGKRRHVSPPRHRRTHRGDKHRHRYRDTPNQLLFVCLFVYFCLFVDQLVRRDILDVETVLHIPDPLLSLQVVARGPKTPPPPHTNRYPPGTGRTAPPLSGLPLQWTHYPLQTGQSVQCWPHRGTRPLLSSWSAAPRPLPRNCPPITLPSTGVSR